VVYDDVHTPAHYWTASGVVGFIGNEPFESKIGFDLEAAKAALAAAGYADGAGFPELKILQTDTPINRTRGAYLVKAWKDNLGITVVEEYVEGRVRSQRFNAEDFDLFPGGWQSDYPDIENYIVGLFNTTGGNNHYNCSLPAVDAAIEQGGQAADDEARIAAYQEAETAIVENLCGAIPIYQEGRPWLVDSSIGGVNSNGVLDASLPGSWNPEEWFIKASS
jgi:oligopeptide transport system substrate-binding protein